MTFTVPRRALAATALLLGSLLVTGPAVADALYETVGRWKVVAVTVAGAFAGCAADLDNGRMTLRLASDGKVWRVGYPAKGRARTIETYFGFDYAGEVGNFRTSGDGWALMPIDSDQVEAFRTNPSFSLTFDKGEQTWKLAGAVRALDRAAACIRTGGRP